MDGAANHLHPDKFPQSRGLMGKAKNGLLRVLGLHEEAGAESKYTIKKAFDLYAATFQRFNQTPIKWDHKQQKLQYIKGLLPLKVWYFNTIVGVFLGMFCCTCTILGKQMFNSDGKIPLFKLLILGVLAVIVLLALTFYLNMLAFGEDYVRGYNQLVELEMDIKRIEANSTRILNVRVFKTKLDKNSEFAEQNIVGKMLILLVHVFVHSPVSLTLACLIVKLDPFYFIIQYIEDSFQLTLALRAAFHITRTVLILIAALEVCRLWPFVLLLLISHFVRINNCLHILHKISLKIHGAAILQGRMSQVQSQLCFLLISRHIQLDLTMIFSQFFLLNGTFAILSAGMIIGSMSNFGTLKFYNIIPAFVYQFFPFVSILIPFFVHATLPPCHRINSKSKQLKILWQGLDKANVSGQKGYLMRHAKAIRELRVYSGIKRLRLFWLKKSTQVKYYDAIQMNTVELLLSIPDSLLEMDAKAAFRSFGSSKIN